MRFGRRLSVETALAPEAADLPVPPLVLQPLVENAVRHGIATRLEGGTIEIAARRTRDYAVIDVRNPKDADTTRPGTVLGLDLVRRRVLAMFGSRAAVTISSAAESYVVSVSVPVVREADEAARESQVMLGPNAAGQIPNRSGDTQRLREGHLARRFGARGGPRAVTRLAEALRVVIVDDEEPARLALRDDLQALPGVEIVGECANGFEAVRVVAETSPYF